MPVLLTRPATTVARATGLALLADGAEVRTFGPRGVPALRAAGAFAASGDHDDHGRLEAALEQVHTLVHVGVGLLDPTAEVWAAHAELVLGAAVGAGVQRVLLLSLPGADPGADDPVRRAAGEVELVAAAAPLPTVVVRPALVDTAAVRDAVAALGPTPDEVVVAPVRLDDLVAALVELDRARSRAAEGHLVLAAPGPEPLTLAAWLARTGVRPHGGVVDFVGRTYRPGGATAPLRHALAGPWEERPDAVVADLWEVTGVVPRPVAPSEEQP